MQKWEYKVIGHWPTKEELNDLGLAGWELVSVAVAGGDHDYQDTVRAYLKRPISN